MSYARLCIHKEIKAHPPIEQSWQPEGQVWNPPLGQTYGYKVGPNGWFCPGGEFLADDAPHCEHCYEVGYKDGEANVIADHTQEVTR